MEQSDFRILFESIPGLFLILSPDLTIVGASDQYLLATMTRRDEITGRKLFDVFPDNPDDKEANGVLNLRNSLQYVLKNRLEHKMEIQKYDIRKPDGSFEERYWSPLNKPVFNNENEILYIIHRVEDVTELEHIKREATRTDEILRAGKRFRAMIENSIDAITMNDADGVPVYQSPSADRICGWTIEERKQKKNFSFIHPDDQEKVKTAFQIAVSNPGIPSPVSYRFKHKKGHFFWVEGVITNFLEDPEIRAVVSNIRDITEKKEAEKIHSLFSLIVNSSEDAIISVDLYGNVTSWNRGAEILFGYTFENICGKPINRIIPPQLYDEETNMMNKIRNGEVVEHYETERMKKDGTVVSISITVSPIHDAEANIIGVSKICHDITERRKSVKKINELNISLEKRAEELLESNEELERFAYIASHDLQEPLRMVTSFLQLLKKKYTDQLDETANKYISFAVDGSDRMKNLIQDLLEYSRVGVNKDDFAEVDLNLVSREVLGMFSESIRNSSAQITTAQLPLVKGRKVQLQQLFQNLLSNAIKYRSEATPVIQIGCLDKKSYWEFFIRDNGIGIDPKFNEKIFIIFQRLHNKSEYAGTGIGLSICRKIIEVHGGNLWVESEIGKGSTFRFTLLK
jgi:PAS domain S-box-containing protein